VQEQMLTKDTAVKSRVEVWRGGRRFA
jgi:hypothetical protein